jgi:hypothetical protein
MERRKFYDHFKVEGYPAASEYASSIVMVSTRGRPGEVIYIKLQANPKARPLNRCSPMPKEAVNFKAAKSPRKTLAAIVLLDEAIEMHPSLPWPLRKASAAKTRGGAGRRKSHRDQTGLYRR